MPKKTLPTYYYLDHFHEFLDYIKAPCAHLLTPEQTNWILQFRTLSKAEQCIIARVANRKHALVALKSLAYDEIPNWQTHTQQLIGNIWLSDVRASDLKQVIPQLTKPELLALLLTDSRINLKSSMSKTELVELANENLNVCIAAQSDVLKPYLIRRFDNTLHYFLFLYFGHLKGTLSQFSMRDLGVMRTRSDGSGASARFSSLEEAQSAFWYAQWRQPLREQKYSSSTYQALDELPDAVGTLANQYRDECLWLLGKSMLPIDTDYAMTALALSNADQAQEKWIREAYKNGDKDEVKRRLEMIIDDPQSEGLAIFAQDFLARKYHQKRTSELTDLLNNAKQELSIDSQYINQVENGVVEFYRRQGIIAVRTENTLWLSLFGLIFWEVIYDIDQRSLANEFDIRPNVLLENRLYNDHAEFVEARLAELCDRKTMNNFLLKQVNCHYGKVTTLLHWHSKLLDNIILLLDHVSLEKVISLLRMMAKDFHSLKDGFPDIMVVENGQLRFEEIKAPGDQIRRNQLISINKLHVAGFKVHITRVAWFRDPLQPYVVVDIETTGGNPQHSRITEIGMVKRINGETVAEWQSLINPQRHIPSHITALTGIDNAMVADAPLFSEVADWVDEFTQGCIFVAHNVNFDYGFFKQEFARLDRFYRRPKLCTVREMRKAYPGLKSYSLANLTAHFDIDMQRHHRAMSDAVAAAELLQLTQTDDDTA